MKHIGSMGLVVVCKKENQLSLTLIQGSERSLKTIGAEFLHAVVM